MLSFNIIQILKKNNIHNLKILNTYQIYVVKIWKIKYLMVEEPLIDKKYYELAHYKLFIRFVLSPLIKKGLKRFLNLKFTYNY